MVNEAIKKIEEQQAKFTKKDKQFWVAEQIKDICRSCPEQAELILKDLENKDMSIANAEKKIAGETRKALPFLWRKPVLLGQLSHPRGGRPAY